MSFYTDIKFIITIDYFFTQFNSMFSINGENHEDIFIKTDYLLLIDIVKKNLKE